MAEFEANEFRPDLKEELGPVVFTIVESLKSDPTNFTVAIQHLIHGKVIEYEEKAKIEAKRELDKQKQKILEKLPTEQELIDKFTSFACSPPAQKAMTRLYNNLKRGLDKAEKIAKPIQQKLNSLLEQGENIKSLIRSIGEKILKIAVIIGIISAIITLLKAVLLALGSIPPPFTVPDAVLRPVAQIVVKLEEVVDGFKAVFIESLPESLADLGNLVVKIGFGIAKLIATIVGLIAAIQVIRRALESLYLKYLNTCNLASNDSDGSINTDALTYLEQSDDDINDYYNETLRALKADGNEEVIEKIYNANFQQIGFRRYKI